jgi:Ca2+-binding RTX toxin-like protein
MCFNDHPFVIPGGGGVDNDTATVAASWQAPDTDWDMYVVKDTNGDGSSIVPDGPDEGTEPDSEPVVGSSPTGPNNGEMTTFAQPEGADGSLEPGPYVVRMVNFAAIEPYDLKISFAGPTEFVPATTETWHFSCTYAGEKRVTQDILIGRGERQNLDLSACGLPQKGTGGKCQGANATIVGSKGDDKMVGTKGRDVMIGLGGDDKIKGRGGNDLICSKGGDDRIVGGAGNDTLGGGGGRDRASGGAGDDKIKGGARPDTLLGGGGEDRLIGGGGHDDLDGGTGRDHCSGRRDRIFHC